MSLCSAALPGENAGAQPTCDTLLLGCEASRGAGVDVRPGCDVGWMLRRCMLAQFAQTQIDDRLFQRHWGGVDVRTRVAVDSARDVRLRVQ